MKRFLCLELLLLLLLLSLFTLYGNKWTTRQRRNIPERVANKTKQSENYALVPLSTSLPSPAPFWNALNNQQSVELLLRVQSSQAAVGVALPWPCMSCGGSEIYISRHYRVSIFWDSSFLAAKAEVYCIILCSEV